MARAQDTRKAILSMAITDDLVAAQGETRCSYHPSVQTRLRCSRCGKPICPRCGVRTPVGLRCPECAGVRGLPTYATSAPVLGRAALSGLAVALPVGLLFGFAPDWQFYLALALGFGVAEAMARAANQKRGRDLQLAAMGLVGVGLLVGRVVLAQRLGIAWADVNALSDAILTPGVLNEFGRPVPLDLALRLRPIPDLLFAAIPFLIAWVRFR